MKNRSDYKYQLDHNILFIEDLNFGNKSVTNDIENILEDISEELDTSMDNYRIMYKDSQGVIDGIYTKDGKFYDFYHIGETDYYAAKLKIK